MPELPEVETVVRQLRPVLIGRKVIALNILDSKLDTPEKEAVSGRKILAVQRLGKQIALTLSALEDEAGPLWLVYHLRMSGRLIWDGDQHSRSRKYLRAELILDRGRLFFYDVRRFGLLKIFHSLEEALPKGVDPLSSEFTFRKLKEMLENSKQEIKPWLLRQDRLVGLGNIYASEILFAARIHPRREACSLGSDQLQRLYRAIREVLGLAIEHCGTTFSDFQDTRGQMGFFQHLLSVYNRQGEPCPDCGSPIQRLVQQQRSTFFCPDCQR